jgi:hypothetical protein
METKPREDPVNVYRAKTQRIITACFHTNDLSNLNDKRCSTYKDTLPVKSGMTPDSPLLWLYNTFSNQKKKTAILGMAISEHPMSKTKI